MQIFSEEMKAQIDRDLAAAEQLAVCITARELYLSLVLTKIGSEVTSIPYPSNYIADNWIEKATKTLKEISPTAGKAIEELNVRELYHL